LNHLEFNSDLWMEVGSSGGPDKNQVYGLSNTKAENLQAARSVSTVGSPQSVSSTQSKEFVALQQHTTQLTEKYDHLLAEHAQLKAEHAQQKAEDAQRYAQLKAEHAQLYAQQKAKHDQLREFIMNMASQSGDTCAPPPFWPYNNQPPPPPPAPPLC
jgi:hypothetical protein